MTRLFSTQLLISEGNQRHLTDFIHWQDILLGLQPNHENFKRMEGGASSKGYNCLAEGCRSHFTNKESAHSHIHAIHSFIGLQCSWVRFDGCHPHPVSRTGKHSRSTLAASMVPVWKHLLDMRIQRLSNFEMGQVDNWDGGWLPYL